MQFHSYAWLITLAVSGLLFNACHTTELNLRGKHNGQQGSPIAPGESQLPGNGGSSPTTGAGSIPDSSTVTITPYLQGSTSNVFANSKFFIDPGYNNNLTTSALQINEAESLATIANIKAWGGTGIWIDEIAAIDKRLKVMLAAARNQSKNQSKPVVMPIVIYDLPNRDCNALASNGELLLDDDGMNKYKTKYIDPIVELLALYPDIRIAAIVEPDSLPNIVTALRPTNPNFLVTKCSQPVFAAYKEGISYALRKLSLPNVAVYLDAGHSGWMGYSPADREAFIQIVREVTLAAGGFNTIRGLATNVANYSPLDIPSTNPITGALNDKDLQINTEHGYVDDLAQIMRSLGFKDPHFVIDTGRNGETKARTKIGNWCNIARARIGRKPEAQPRTNVDAYVWVKAPGESDGSSINYADALTKKKDSTCEYTESNPDPLEVAPIAGKWFHSHLQNLVRPASKEAAVGKVEIP